MTLLPDRTQFLPVAARILSIVLVICLIAGRRPAQAAPPSQTADGRQHVVAAGETLSQIAEGYGVSAAALMAANGIDDADAILEGQILLLPAAAEQDALAVQVDPAYADLGPPIVHAVQPGETLSQIAERYAVPMAELMRINGLADADLVVEGQRLRLTPALETQTAQSLAATESPPLVSANAALTTLNRRYEVQFGDTLEQIALREGVNVDALAAINGLDRQPTPALASGQPLILPATTRELRAQASNQPPAAEEAAELTVQPGDSLSQLAQDAGVSLADLMAVNRIVDPDAIYIGQTLTLPPPPAAHAEEDEPPRQSGRARSGFFHYTVRPGDALSVLARDFDSTMLAILEYNDLPDAETLYSGLELRIPFGPPDLPVQLPPTPLSGTRFLVSLSRQQCWVLRGEHVLHTWPCSTGYGGWITRTGTFAVQTKLELAKSGAYELDMPYWLGIYDVGSYENGIHGLPVKWETGEKIWSGLVGQPATFGCAMLEDDDAAALYDLAYVGMPVHIVP